MRVYFLRHAEAADGPNDDLRRLTERGRKQAAAIGQFLHKNRIEIQSIYTSPLVRARQTAEIVAEICTYPSSNVEAVDWLRNETPDALFHRSLKFAAKDGPVLLVGHNPSLSHWIAKLLQSGDVPGLVLSKGALAALKVVRQSPAELRLWITPKALLH